VDCSPISLKDGMRNLANSGTGSQLSQCIAGHRIDGSATVDEMNSLARCAFAWRVVSTSIYIVGYGRLGVCGAHSRLHGIHVRTVRPS